VPSPVDDYLAAVHAAHLPDSSGHVADQIPEMTEVDHDAFGICLATADGHIYEAGDTRTDFTIQSISKTLTYGLALADRGFAAVDERIDVEPSGEAFYEISLGPQTGRPRNAMINAGAIAAASLIAGAGDAPAGIFFIVSGQATADVTDDDGAVHRVAVLPAGTSFGKRAVISGEPHATDVHADTALELFVLTPEKMRELERRAPRTAIALLRTMFLQERSTADVLS
jgi:CRP-like cAMP-binding protein